MNNQRHVACILCNWFVNCAMSVVVCAFHDVVDVDGCGCFCFQCWLHSDMLFKFELCW